MHDSEAPAESREDDRPPLAPSELEVEWIEVDGVELALFSLPAPDSPPPIIRASEAAVLRGVLLGRSNAEIARERGTSPRTVANRIALLLRKFGVASRYELITAVVGRGGPGGDT